MNNADSNHPAVASASRSGTGVVRRLVNSSVTIGFTMIMLVASNPALADPPQGDQRYQQRSERAARQREDVRHFDPRDYEAREQEQRRRVQMENRENRDNNSSDRRGGRLIPDERRDLRRQINEAGMDIYPNTPRR